MPDMTITEGRANLAEAVDRARVEREPVVLTKHGKPVAAIIDATLLADLIRDAEDLADIRAARAAREELAETDATPIPWDEVKADLGLT